jgi:hypothetical protein
MSCGPTSHAYKQAGSSEEVQAKYLKDSAYRAVDRTAENAS